MKSKLQKLIDSLPDSFEKKQIQKLVDLHLDDLSESYYVARMPEEEFKLFQEYKSLKDKQNEVSGIKSDVYNAVNRSFEVIQDLFNFISVNDLEKFKDDRIEKLMEEKTNLKIMADGLKSSLNNANNKLVELKNANNICKLFEDDLEFLQREFNILDERYKMIPNWIRWIFIH